MILNSSSSSSYSSEAVLVLSGGTLLAVDTPIETVLYQGALALSLEHVDAVEVRVEVGDGLLEAARPGGGGGRLAECCRH